MMQRDSGRFAPAKWDVLRARSEAFGFGMPSDACTGSVLEVLAASKPGGHVLEIGTGTGLATAWLLAGMDQASRLVSVDADPACQDIARSVLGDDPRATFQVVDGLTFIRAQPASSYDLIFADAWPGKYEGLEDALALLRPGGFFVGDDMLPQPNWPDGHQRRVDALLERLRGLDGWLATFLTVGSGIVIAARRTVD